MEKVYHVVRCLINGDVFAMNLLLAITLTNQSMNPTLYSLQCYARHLQKCNTCYIRQMVVKLYEVDRLDLQSCTYTKTECKRSLLYLIFFVAVEL